MKQVFTILATFITLTVAAQPGGEKPSITNPNPTSNEEYKTLVGAAGHGDSAAVVKFIKQGVNVNAVDKNGNTALIMAARFGELSIVKMLIKAGATIDEPRSPKGRTALMAALAYANGIEMTKLLVENGANVNARAADGTTPLIIAAAGAKYNVVKYLIEKGADVNAKDNNGKNALTWAGECTEETIKKINSCRDCLFSKPSTVKLLQEKMQ